MLTARLFDGEKPIGKSLHLRTDYHKGIGKKITYAPGGRYYQHKEVYKGGGDAGLLDGLRGGKSYMDGRWQGFCPNDLDAIIDLGEVTAIHRVMANFMQIRTPQVFLPAKVEVWASVDGKNFTLLGSDICSEEEAGKDVIFRDFGWIGTPTETRYVRFHAIQGRSNSYLRMKSSYNNTHPVFMKQNKKRIRVKLHAFFVFLFSPPHRFYVSLPPRRKDEDTQRSNFNRKIVNRKIVNITMILFSEPHPRV